MNENQQKPRRRSIFSIIFPYILLAAAIMAIVAVVVSNIDNSEHWAESQLEEKLNENLVYDVTVKIGDTNTIVSGSFLNKDGKERTFTARVSTYDWNHERNIIGLTDPAPSWSTLFNNEITEWNESGNHKTIATLIQKDYYEVSWWQAWGPTIIMLGGSLLITLFIVSRLLKGVNGTNNKAMEFNKSRARREDHSKVKFTDVAGCDEEKAEMAELVDYLKEPKKYSKLGAKLPKGVLLVGPPGTGKTLLAKAVAGEANVPFYSISGSDFVEMFVGVGAGRVRDMFKIAKQTAPCLVFIDEIDAVGRQRGAGLGGGNDEREQTLNQLLVEMDGFEDNSGIIVIAATNRDDVLDPALLRAGRFDRQITVSLPDSKGRAEIFKVHARHKKVDPNIDFNALAKRTVGFSGADIANIMNEAAILAIRAKREEIRIEDVDEAIDRRIAGPAKSSRSISPLERKEIAYHEAGHAIIGLRLPNSDKVQKITIIPRGQTGGHVLMTPEDDKFLATKKELIARIVGYLGGRTSEEIFFEDITTGAHNDIEVATRIARLMVTEYGMSALGPIQYERDTGSVFLGRDYTSTQQNFSAQIAVEIDKEIRKIIDEAHEEARRIITENKDDVILIAETLLEKETITAEEIAYLLEHRTLKKEEPVVESPVVEEAQPEVKEENK